MIEKFPPVFEIKHVATDGYNEDEQAGAEIMFAPKRRSSLEDPSAKHGTKVFNLADLRALTNWAQTTAKHIGGHDLEIEFCALDGHNLCVVVLCSADKAD